MAERALPDLVSRVVVDTSPLEAALTGITGALSGMVSRTKDAGQEAEGHISGIGTAFLGVGAAVAGSAVAVGAAAVKMASDFDTSTRQMAGAAQLPVASAQAIANSFLNTGDVSTFSAQQMITALGPVSGQLELLSGHALTTAESHQVMSAAADLAEASHTDLGSATKTLSAVMVAYKIPLAEADDATNSLFNTSRAVNVPLDDLQTVLAKVHARLGDVSPGLNETNTLMVDLAINGITGGRAVGAASTALLTLLGGTKPVTDELGKLNVHLYDAKGQFVGLDSVIAQLQKAEAGMTTQQKDQTNAVLFGTTASQEMSSVISGGTATWDKAAKTVDTAGAAHKAAGAAMSGVEGQQKVLSAEMANLGVTIGQVLLPAIVSLLGAILPLVIQLHVWAAAHPQLATAILIGSFALGVLLIVIGGFLVILPGLIAGITALGVVIGAVSLPVLLVALGIAALIAITVLLITHWTQVVAIATSVWQWITQLVTSHQQLAIAAGVVGVAFLVMMGPVGLLILGIVALIAATVLIITHWTQVVAIATSVWHWITQLVTSHQLLAIAVVALLGPIGLLIAAIVVAVTHWQQIWSVLQTVGGAFIATGQAIGGFFVGVFNTITGIFAAVAGFLSGVYGAVAAALNAIWGVITAVLGAIWGFISTWGLTILVIITAPFWLGAIAILAALNAISGFVTSILSAVWAFVAAVFAGIFNTVLGWMTAVWQSAVVSILTAVSNFFVAVLSAIWNFVSAVFGGIFNTIWTWLTSIWNTVVAVLTNIWNFFVAIWTNIWNFVSGVWTGIWGTINFWTTTIFNTIFAWLVNDFNTIFTWFTNIWNTANQIWGGVWGTINFWATSVRDTVSNIFNSLAGIVHNALSALATQVGTDVNWIIHRVNDFLDKVWATFHGFGIDLPIHDVPHLEGYAYAEGGIVDKPTTAIVGEENQPEAIIPWSSAHRDRALDLWQTTGIALGAFPLSGAREGKGAGPDLNNLPTSGHGGQCTLRGTLIATEHGEVPIEDVKVGDRVWTRQGLKRVLWSGLTRPDAEVLCIRAGGRELVLTPDHKVWVESRRSIGPTGPSGTSWTTNQRLRDDENFFGPSCTAHSQPWQEARQQMNYVGGIVDTPGPIGFAVRSLAHLGQISARHDGLEPQQNVVIGRDYGHSGAAVALAAGPALRFKKSGCPGDGALRAGIQEGRLGARRTKKGTPPRIGDHCNEFRAASVAQPWTDLRVDLADVPRRADPPLPQALDVLRLAGTLYDFPAAHHGREQFDDIPVAHDEGQAPCLVGSTLPTTGQRHESFSVKQSSGPSEYCVATDTVDVHPEAHSPGVRGRAVPAAPSPFLLSDPHHTDPRWTEAKDLCVGDLLLLFDEAKLEFRPVPIEAIEQAPRGDTFDLTVDSAHEFVADSILISNCLAFLGGFFPQLAGIPAAKDAASLINSNTAKPGEIAINTSFAPYGHAALVINPPSMVLDSNWGEDEMIRIHPLADVKAAGFIDMGAKLGTLAGGAAGGIVDVAQQINTLIDQVLGEAGAGPKWLTGTLPALLKNMMGPGIIDYIKKNFAAQLAKLTSSVAGSFSAIKGAFAGGVDQWITQGEQLAGVGDDWHAALKARIGVESGGDPNIDQSGLTGYAQAHGIAQMINSTFQAYALPGHGNIYNPVDNIAAAIKYIESRYGGWQGMPPLSQGYDEGGVFPTGTVGYNTSGEDEYVFTKNQLQGLGGGPADERVLQVLQSIEQKVMGHLEVNTYGTNLTPRDVAREIVQEVRTI